jgi:hypothetical protein
VITGINRRTLGLAVVPAVAVLTVCGAGAAAADAPDFSYAVGVPSAKDQTAEAGAVDLRLSGIDQTQWVSELKFEVVPLSETAHARFGAAVLSADLDFDQNDDLVAGAPGTGTTMTGRVDVLFGNPAGAVGNRDLAGLPLVGPQAGDRFGAAVALSARISTDNADTGMRDLWVGAPGYDVGGKLDAGAVFRYAVSAEGTISYLQTITQDSSLVPGAAEAGDHFGAVLAGGGVNGVVVGVPDEDIGSRKDAGTVQRLRTDRTADTLIAATDLNQDTAGVPGTAEAGDHFGAALSRNGHAVGVPGEDVGKLKDAGSVQTFGPTRTPVDSLAPSVAYTQNSTGIPGTAEAGDRFGAAVSEGIYQCNENVSVVIGAPGEDIGKVKDAGSVTVALEPAISGLILSQCPAKAYSQGSGLPGKAEAGDQLGAAVGTKPGDPDTEEDRMDRIVTGVPGEDVDGITDTGRVISGFGSFASTIHYLQGDLAGLRFGSVLFTFVE